MTRLRARYSSSTFVPGPTKTPPRTPLFYYLHHSYTPFVNVSSIGTVSYFYLTCSRARQTLRLSQTTNRKGLVVRGTGRRLGCNSRKGGNRDGEVAWSLGEIRRGREHARFHYYVFIAMSSCGLIMCTRNPRQRHGGMNAREAWRWGGGCPRLRSYARPVDPIAI